MLGPFFRKNKEAEQTGEMGVDLCVCAARNPRQIANEGLAFSKNVMRLTDLRDDDDLAEEEAKAQGGMPGYCSDRYFRAAAGGQYCQKFDSSRSK